jgi:hypothetical protein
MGGICGGRERERERAKRNAEATLTLLSGSDAGRAGRAVKG